MINSSVGPCIMVQGMLHIEDFCMLGVGAKFNELLIIDCIFFVFFGIWRGGDVP